MSSSLQPDINKFPSAHNRGHDFQKFKSLQGCPNLAHHKLSWSTKDIPSPKTIRSDSASRLQDISTMVKQVQQHHPNVPTNPDRSCTYLVLRAHSDEHYVQLKPTLKFPRGGPAVYSVWTNTRRSTGPGGSKIKMTLESAEPKGKGDSW